MGIIITVKTTNTIVWTSCERLNSSKLCQSLFFAAHSFPLNPHTTEYQKPQGVSHKISIHRVLYDLLNKPQIQVPKNAPQLNSFL